MKISNHNQRGFTLLEMVVSVALITVGTLGVFSAVTKYSQYTQQSKDNFTAVYLCQEGIEIVKNIRDTNWIIGGATTWKDGLTICASGCEADFEDTVLTPWTSGSDLYIEYSAGQPTFYRYLASPTSNDVKTPYKRKIIISDVSADEIHVQVDVYWDSHTMTVKENLYNWK